jgi:hydrogenase maturation protein HypF
VGARQAGRFVGERRRLRLDVTGAVQGVGFRPFVHRLATAEGLAGFVRNTAAGATVEVEGSQPAIDRFLGRLDAELAAPARIAGRAARKLPPVGETGFVVAPSAGEGTASALVLPDLVTCADCLAEILDPADRRHLYPFTTCTHCGPRYSIIAATPYDRARTAMRHFPMCPACAAEYADPASRRFHAETNACPDCGPQLTLRDAQGFPLATGHVALHLLAGAIRSGGIVALEGLGGFQLLADASNEAAVAALRERKRRPAKPFAVMATDLAAARDIAEITPAEAALLASAAGPIVLVRARPDAGLAPGVAPGNPNIGLMLPTTPLHHLLLRELGTPVIATSGNRGGEPIVSEPRAALERLAGIAELFLVHDRPIVQPVDDSVVRVIAGEATVLRLARGYAPLVLDMADEVRPGIALGGQQKDAVALATGTQIILGPHIGDLDRLETREALRRSAADLAALHGVVAEWCAADAHPDYFSSHLMRDFRLPAHRVPHHAAHVLSGMLDNGLEGEVLGVAWDGAGYGGDGTVWGGEFLAITDISVRRVAHLLPFRLPGGDAAARDPRRAALGVLHALAGGAPSDLSLAPVAPFTIAERKVLAAMMNRGFNAPLTSSAGRLFDAVASLLGLCQRASFEGEAAMAVEFAALRATRAAPLAPITLSEASPIVLDWRPTLASLIDALRGGTPVESLAAGFHLALAAAIAATAHEAGLPRVLLTGGCFQNARLTEAALAAIAAAGLKGYHHRRVPPNDGGLAAGQALFAARLHTEEKR